MVLFSNSEICKTTLVYRLKILLNIFSKHFSNRMTKFWTHWLWDNSLVENVWPKNFCFQVVYTQKSFCAKHYIHVLYSTWIAHWLGVFRVFQTLILCFLSCIYLFCKTDNYWGPFASVCAMGGQLMFDLVYLKLSKKWIIFWF